MWPRRAALMMCVSGGWSYIGGPLRLYLARSAKLPEGLYILPMFFLYFFIFFIFFNGRLSSHRS